MPRNHNFLVIKTSKFIGIIISVILVCVISSLNDSLTTIEWATVFTPIILLVLNRYTTGKIFTLYNLFIIILAIFHYGVFWLDLFGIPIDTSNGYDLIARYPESTIVYTIKYTLLSMTVLNFAAMIIIRKVNGLNISKPEYNSYRIARVIFYGLLPLILFNDFSRVILTRTYSYSSAVYMSSFIGRFEICFLIASLFVIAYRSKDSKYVFIYMLLRCFLLMVLSGSRIGMILELILLLFLKVSLDKISFRKTIGLVILAFIALVFIGYVKQTRGALSISIWDYIADGGIFSSVLSEFGSTMITPLLAVTHDSAVGNLNGLSYLSSILTLIPFSTRVFPFITEYRAVHDLLNQYAPAIGTLGGSFFAEQFMNFGFAGIWLSLPFGLLFGFCQNKVYEENNSFKNIIYVALFYGILIYSRGNMYDFISNINGILYFLVFYYLLRNTIFRSSLEIDSYGRGEVDDEIVN